MCLYTKNADDDPGAQYCFQEVLLADAASVTCESESFTDITSSLASTNQQPSTTVQPTTTTPLPPLNEVLNNSQTLQNLKLTHEANLTALQNQDTEASTAQDDLDKANEAIEKIINGTARRTRRQIQTITSCSDIKAVITEIKTNAESKNYQEVSRLSKLIISTTVTCTEAERQELNDKKTELVEAKTTVKVNIEVKKKQIEELKHKLNKVIDDLIVVNNQLVQHQQTTIHQEVIGTKHEVSTTTVSPTTPAMTTIAPSQPPTSTAPGSSAAPSSTAPGTSAAPSSTAPGTSATSSVGSSTTNSQTSSTAINAGTVTYNKEFMNMR